VCQQVAFNHQCPPEVLREITFSQRAGIDVAAMSNPNCPPDVIAWVAQHAVKWFHPETITDKDLALGDTDKHIACRIVRNPSCPPDILVQALQVQDPDESRPNWVLVNPNRSVRFGVAGNPNCPPSIIAELLRDSSTSVQWQAAANPSCPQAALAMWQLARR
jgi:hypothetical protein